MTRKYYHLWSEVVNFSNLLRAFRRAAKGKRSKAQVAAFEFNLESQLLKLKADLEGGDYQPGNYASFLIHDPKRRLISAAPFCDRVIHHALMNVIEPLFERQFIFDSYANRRGKGRRDRQAVADFEFNLWKAFLCQAERT